MELARLRTEYRAARGVALRVALGALVAFGAALVFVDGRWFAFSLFLADSFGAVLAFAMFWAVVRAFARRHAAGDATFTPPTLVTYTGVLQPADSLPPLCATRLADAETVRRHIRDAVPAAVGFCGGMAGGMAVILTLDGKASSVVILNALAIAAGQGVGLTLIHLGSERWVAA